MPAVRRSDENRILRKFKKAFTKLISMIRGEKSKSVEELVSEFTLGKEAQSMIEQTSREMVTCQRVESAKSWREAATIGSRGQEIYAALKNEMKGPIGDLCRQMALENSSYIKTLPEDWARYVTLYTMREAMKGRRPEAIEAELRKIVPGHIAKNLKCIVRTEMAKANASLTQARAENLNISAYIWHAANDERTRHSHSGMDGLLVFYNNPPNPEALFPQSGVKAYGRYHAGNTFNCRCWQEPVVDWSFLPDSIRVVTDDGVKTMTREAIIRKYGR